MKLWVHALVPESERQRNRGIGTHATVAAVVHKYSDRLLLCPVNQPLPSPPPMCRNWRSRLFYSAAKMYQLEPPRLEGKAELACCTWVLYNIHRRHDFNGPSEIEDILKSYLHTGFQSTNVGLAIEQINQMVRFVSSHPNSNP